MMHWSRSRLLKTILYESERPIWVMEEVTLTEDETIAANAAQRRQGQKG